MSREKSRESKEKIFFFAGLALIAAVFVVVLAVFMFRGMEADREKGVAEAEARKALAAKEQAQSQAWQGYFRKRFKRLEKLQKKRARTYSKPNKSQRNLTVAAILVDDDEDGLPELVVDQPALQYERKKGGVTHVTYDGMYMGNIQVGIYNGEKVLTMPRKARKVLLRKKHNISSTVYISPDRSRVSVVICTGGEEGAYDGYLYELKGNKIKEVKRMCGVREYVRSTTKGSLKSTPEFIIFQKTFVLSDATIYKENISYDKDGNMRHYSSLKKYRKVLADRGIRLEAGDSKGGKA